jgi:hypothetical protein
MSISGFLDDYAMRADSRQIADCLNPVDWEVLIMKYLCLVYVEEKTLDALPKNERVAISNEAMAYCENLQKLGQLLAASPLHPVDTATTVRVREGKTSTTDGPFAETKEQLGGFLMIDVPDLNDAIRVAAHFPAARIGSVEVRPMKELGCAD